MLSDYRSANWFLLYWARSTMACHEPRVDRRLPSLQETLIEEDRYLKE